MAGTKKHREIEKEKDSNLSPLADAPNEVRWIPSDPAAWKCLAGETNHKLHHPSINLESVGKRSCSKTAGCHAADCSDDRLNIKCF